MKIPLFPLDVVLFPGAPLPLHIFEERYKEMIALCLQEHSSFGVVRAQSDGLAIIGCTARITRDNNGTCAQQVFDNQTGRMMRSSQPCEATTYDSNGMPVPVGTIHRLDAISKGFGK